jgi:16S rRNA (cytidine1402-2'-O)-methyltransferase
MDDLVTTGQVVLAATPLGNPGDASARLREALANAPVIAAEDTRRLRRLCADLGVEPSGRVVSFFEANESARLPQLLDVLRTGTDVLVVTDAGMPSVSDPGYRLVTAAVAENIHVTVLPGPSAVLAALAMSGLPVDRFCFEGFLPRKAFARERALRELEEERRTMVFFEAPHRLPEMLAALREVLGEDRPAAICREITKTYEQTIRGPLGELAEWAATAEVRGEITVVVGGALESTEMLTAAQLAAMVEIDERFGGISRKEAIAAVAKAHGVSKRTVFDAVVAAKSQQPDPSGVDHNPP